MPEAVIAQALDRVHRDPPRVVCLPDLFLDHIVEIPDWSVARERVEAAIERGGGNLLGTPQALHPGGNAANAAWALARVGADVELAGITGPEALPLFEASLGRDGVDLSCVDPIGAPSLTTVLRIGEPPANAMMNEPGALASLGPADLTPDVQAAIEAADAVLVANWASMAEHGTAFVEAALETAGHADTLTYLDAADPTERSAKDRTQLIDALAANGLGVWAMNEHEAAAFADAANPDEAGRLLAERTGAIVDVHTHERAISFQGRSRTEAPAFEVEEVQRTTGAGDAFNAGNLLGHTLGLEPEDRLTLAHTVAGAFVAHPERRPPDRSALQRFDGRVDQPSSP